MYYRRKFALALLEALARPVGKVEMQKYVFLATQVQEKSAYQFIPHRYGCYSFQLDADKRTLTKYGYVRELDHWALERNRKQRFALKQEDRKAVWDVVERYGDLSSNELIRETYVQFPYYATRSEIAEKLLSPVELESVHQARPRPQPARCFTIGYEGRTLEEYVRELIRQDVQVLCDLRRNPVSMKFGFSKGQLQRAAMAAGIRYKHLPGLGISSDQRKDLVDEQDYRALFAKYKRTTLRQNRSCLDRLVELVKNSRRIALTCFESDHGQCHRGCVAEALNAREDFPYRIIHL